MPKQINGFQCEKCLTIYPDMRDAEICEKRHTTPEIVRFEWTKGKFLPESIIVRYERDGTKHEQNYY